MSGGQELEARGVPVLYLDKNSLLDEKYISSVHSVAETTVHDVVQEAVEDLTRAVADATQWLADAVRGELLSQAVASAEPPDRNPVEEGQEEISSTELPGSPGNYLRSQGDLPPLTLSLGRPSSAVVRAVAKATVEDVTDEALGGIVQAVERATEWFSQAVESELISQSVAPDESVDATEWRTEADDNAPVVHAVAGASIVSKEPEIAEISAVVDVPLLSLQSSEISVCHLHELAKATAEEVVRQALDDVTKATGDNSRSLTQVVHEELPERAVAEENSPSLRSDINPPAPVPALQLPNAAPNSPEHVAESHALAVPFVNDVVSTALQQVKPATNPLEAEEYADEEYEEYTPLNSPTSEAASSRSPIPSTRPPEPETQPEPPVSVVAAPPDPQATPRKKSPITSKRQLGTPRLNENPPSSAPPVLPSPRTNHAPTEPAPSVLPPLVLPAVQSAGKSKRLQTPRKTPRVPVSNDEEVYTLNSSRSSSSRLNKHSSRASAELELTPKSSARAAAFIYGAQQPPSSRHHQHHRHKPKKLRDSATQTSPPPSPPPQPLPRQCLPVVHDESNPNEQLPKPQSKHSPRDTPAPESIVVKKPESSNNTLLAPLSKAPVVTPCTDSSTKASSPSRSHKSHGHKPSPTKRSGYCQRCTFEGRSCKINDCLKHQALK